MPTGAFPELAASPVMATEANAEAFIFFILPVPATEASSKPPAFPVASTDTIPTSHVKSKTVPASHVPSTDFTVRQVMPTEAIPEWPTLCVGHEEFAPVQSTPESIVPESTIEESSSRAHSKESSPVPAVEVIVFEPAPERAVPVSAPTPEFAPVSAEKDSKSVSESDPATLKDTLEPVSNPVSKTLSNCSVAVCAVFRCDVNLMRNERKFYKISGNVSSGWIEQIGIRSASFQLVSTASLDYDEDKYIYFADSLSSVPVCELNTQVEVYEEPSILKEVIVGVIGGLMIISLITAVLYKSGFFKRKAKQQIKDPAQEADEVDNLNEI
ncbi:integrin alpha-M-like protein [Labeo rohita]|uniref:Integrin alpha-M-like protein n=1 Tax=Labeo rohita TaxID=84645 RepID=A0A498MSY2_LABRO|nr:integrin alpha-M-like protein [Labeo rohita]